MTDEIKDCFVRIDNDWHDALWSISREVQGRIFWSLDIKNQISLTLTHGSSAQRGIPRRQEQVENATLIGGVPSND